MQSHNHKMYAINILSLSDSHCTSRLKTRKWEDIWPPSSRKREKGGVIKASLVDRGTVAYRTTQCAFPGNFHKNLNKNFLYLPEYLLPYYILIFFVLHNSLSHFSMFQMHLENKEWKKNHYYCNDLRFT